MFLCAEKSPSKQAYDEAIRVCSRSGLMNFEAMANEAAALYFFDEGDEDWAMYYMTRALGLYGDWGATGKAEILQEEYKFEEPETRMKSTNLRGRCKYRPSVTAATKEVCFGRDDLETSETNALSDVT